jgi:hypothetical protein
MSGVSVPGNEGRLVDEEVPEGLLDKTSAVVFATFATGTCLEGCLTRKPTPSSERERLKLMCYAVDAK